MGVPILFIEMDDAGLSARGAEGRVVHVPWEGLEGFEEALGRLAQEMPLGEFRKAIVLIPGSWISFRYLRLPFTKKRALSEVLPMEIGPLLPDPEIPFVFDFKVIDDGEEESLVLVAAVATEKMEMIFSPLSQLGIRPDMVVPAGLTRAMASLGLQETERSFFHVYLSGEEAALTLVQEGRPLVVRSLAWSVRDGDGTVLALEIVRTLASAGMRTDQNWEQLDKIPLIVEAQEPGGVKDTLPAVEAAMEQAGHPMEVVRAAPLPQDLSAVSAIPVINLCTGPFKAGGFAGQYRWHLFTSAALAILALCLALIGMFRQNATLEAEVARIRQESVAVYRETFPDSGSGPVQAPLMRMESRMRQVREETGSQQVFDPGPKIRVMSLLQDLSSRIPTDIDVTLSRLVLSNDRVILTGTVKNFNDVNRIKGLIQASAFFRQVEIASAEADKKEGQVRFKFIAEI